MTKSALSLLFLPLVAAYPISGAVAATPVATGVLHDAAGADHGRVELSVDGESLHGHVMVSSLTPGMHGIHIHMVGQCEAPGFTTAGGHWNPDGKQHGHANPMGPHRGDLPQINVGADGTGSVDFSPMAKPGDLLDADGSALVVHAAADDERTDPAGNSGARVLCAVLAK